MLEIVIKFRTSTVWQGLWKSVRSAQVCHTVRPQETGLEVVFRSVSILGRATIFVMSACPSIRMGGKKKLGSHRTHTHYILHYMIFPKIRREN